MPSLAHQAMPALWYDVKHPVLVIEHHGATSCDVRTAFNAALDVRRRPRLTVHTVLTTP